MSTSPVWEEMLAAGGVAGDYHGRKLVRHFGDPAGEYAAATEGLAVFDRSHRARLLVSGRAPGQMLNGILTGRMPTGPVAAGEGVLGGEATYHAVLTPKGKMLTDLWAMSRGTKEAEELLLDVPVAGLDALSENFRKFIPPRFATVTDVSAEVAMITVSGPQAAATLSRLALGLRVGSEELSALAEGEWRLAGPAATGGLAVVRTMEVWPEAWTVVGPADSVAALWKVLVAEGARPAGLGVWSTLRVEAARPVYGTDMDADTIPVEAGIHDRAIDYQKGCYTGQEVIVRIRDRGKVNRQLRLLHLGDAPAPARGAELHRVDDPEKVAGHVTSVVESPRFGETIALAYVRAGLDEVLLSGKKIAVPTD